MNVERLGYGVRIIQDTRQKHSQFAAGFPSMHFDVQRSTNYRFKMQRYMKR